MTIIRTIPTSTSPALYYRQSGKGPAIVLLHGFPATGNLWDEVLDGLSRHFTLLIPDLPGTGHSRLEGETISIQELGDAVYSMLNDAGFEQAVIAGHSMGGYIALSFAQKYPKATAGLALIHSTAVADDTEKKQSRQKTIALIRKGGKDGFVRSFIPTLFGNDFKEVNPERIATQIAAASTMPDATMIAFYTAMMERGDTRETLASAAFPVQWVMGGEDSLIPPVKAIQQTSIPDVSFVNIYPASGHMSMMECPARLAKDLEAFGKYCYSSVIYQEVS